MVQVEQRPIKTTIAMYLLKDNPELISFFKRLYTSSEHSEIVREIILLIGNNNLNEQQLKATLNKFSIEDIRSLKDELLDVLMAYIENVMDDYLITEKEQQSTDILKRYFKIREGDFYRYKFNTVESLLHRQFKKLYADNIIDKQEAIHHVYLQGLFDLSYDQFDEFKRSEVLRSLDDGGNYSDLDSTQKR